MTTNVLDPPPPPSRVTADVVISLSLSPSPLRRVVQYGKDYYYRAHPEDLKALYAAADEFHRMWDVITEFDSLSTLSQVGGRRRRR